MHYFSLKGKLYPTIHPVPLPRLPEQWCSRGTGGTSFLGALLDHLGSQDRQANQYTCTPLLQALLLQFLITYPPGRQCK